MKRIRYAGLTVLLVATVALSGCGAIVDRVEQGVEDAVAGQGGEIDIDLNGNDGGNCLPEWVNMPDGEVVHSQGLSGGADTAEICVVSVVAQSPVDVSQSLPRIAEGTDFSQYLGMLALFAPQAGIGTAELTELLDGAKLQEGLAALEEEGIHLGAYGDGGRVLLVATSDVNQPEVQINVGVMCEGSC